MDQQHEHAEMVAHVWRTYLTTGEIPDELWPLPLTFKNYRRIMRALPADPRCSLCSIPFEGPGGWAVRALMGRTRSRMNPLM